MDSPGFFKTKLWQVLKWFGVGVAIMFLLFGIVSWVVFEKKNAWLLSEIQSYVNESQSGQLNIKVIDLKLFKSFPLVTLELVGVDYYEHRDSLRLPDEKPIMHADQLFVAVELLPLMSEELKISEISLKRAQLNIVEYQNGMLNIDKAIAKPVKGTPPIAAKKEVAKSAPAAKPKEKKIEA